MRLLRRIYLCIWRAESSVEFAISSTLNNFSPNGREVKSVLEPCLLIASNFILYAFALSEGKMCSLCKLESTIKIMASSLLKSRTITGRVSMPSFAHAYFLLCPEISSYLSPSPFLTITGLITPNVEMLSTSSAISSSSRTPNGWSGASSMADNGITRTFSRFGSVEFTSLFSSTDFPPECI